MRRVFRHFPFPFVGPDRVLQVLTADLKRRAMRKVGNPEPRSVTRRVGSFETAIEKHPLFRDRCHTIAALHCRRRT